MKRVPYPHELATRQEYLLNGNLTHLYDGMILRMKGKIRNSQADKRFSNRWDKAEYFEPGRYIVQLEDVSDDSDNPIMVPRIEKVGQRNSILYQLTPRHPDFIRFLQWCEPVTDPNEVTVEEYLQFRRAENWAGDILHVLHKTGRITLVDVARALNEADEGPQP